MAALLVAPVALVLAGCNNSSSSGGDSYTAPGAVPPGTSSPLAPSTPAAPSSSLGPVPTVAVPPSSPGRPLTQSEKQYRQLCQAGTVRNGCDMYSDNALRLQGINPES